MRLSLQKRCLVFCVIIAAFCGIIHSEQKDTPVYGRKNPSNYRLLEGVHKGSGALLFQSLIDYTSGIFESNFLWAHRCRIPPKSGIGLNLKRFMEGIYWAINIPAEFTINGHTALLPAGSSALCDMGSYQGIFNPSETDTLEFLHIAVSRRKFPGSDLGVVDLKDNLADTQLESPPSFPWTRLDRTLLKPVNTFHGGIGAIYMRRLWCEEYFRTNWYAVDHVVIPPGSSIGSHRLVNAEALYYILSGAGRFTVNGHSWDIVPDDAVPATLGDMHGVNNDTDKDLELFIMYISMKKGEIPD